MSRSTTLFLGAVIFVLAMGAAVMFSGRGTPEPTETAPSNLPGAPVTPAPPAR